MILVLERTYLFEPFCCVGIVVFSAEKLGRGTACVRSFGFFGVLCLFPLCMLVLRRVAEVDVNEVGWEQGALGKRFP